MAVRDHAVLVVQEPPVFTGLCRFLHFDAGQAIAGLHEVLEMPVVGMITASLIVASALVLRTGAGEWWLPSLVFAASGFLGIWLVWGILRSGRL